MSRRDDFPQPERQLLSHIKIMGIAKNETLCLSMTSASFQSSIAIDRMLYERLED